MPTRHLLVLLALLAAHTALWSVLHTRTPELDVVPRTPGELAIKALSLGDEQFYFRHLGVMIQNFGDTFGRATSLQDYDVQRLTNWFDLMDALDARSNFIPALASYYFARTKNTEDVRHIVHYLIRHAERDPHAKWWWLGQAVYIANHHVKDNRLALKAAMKLHKTPADVPVWARQMPAFIYEQLGETDAAYYMIMKVLKDWDTLSPHEINFMQYFINERLDMLEVDIRDWAKQQGYTPKPVPEHTRRSVMER